MTVADSEILTQRDPYRFGTGAAPVLQVGTIGWSVSDLDDPEISALWERGRYEIVDGVLAVMPPAYFRGGSVVIRLQFALHAYFLSRKIRAEYAGEADIAISESRVVRGDCAVVAGADLPKFQALKFSTPNTDWRDHALILPPTIVIESISRGHERHDRVTKRQWYADFGIPNYWMVDAYTQSLECLKLINGEYQMDATGRARDIVRPTAFSGLEIELDEIWGGI